MEEHQHSKMPAMEIREEVDGEIYAENQEQKPQKTAYKSPYGVREIEAVAIMEGCFPEKFGVPRQAGIAKSARGIVRLLPPFNHENYLQGLELSSHIWLTFGFHQNQWNGKATVRPQRLGGNERMGVFATRSSFRPNGLGLSAVKIEAIHAVEGLIEVSGHDLVDGTPIYCIKPYIPFSDAISEATSAFAVEKPVDFAVYFNPQARKDLIALTPQAPYLELLITEVIGQNPTPQFHQDTARIYGVSLKSWNIRFKVLTPEDLPATTLDQSGHDWAQKAFLVVGIDSR